MLKGLAVAGVLLLAAGCGPGASGPASTTPTPTPTPPADGGAFATPAEIMSKAGSTLPCADASPMTATGAKAQSVCQNGDVVIRAYEDHSGIDNQVSLLSIAGGAWLLAGENWSVNAPKAVLDAAQMKLGGKLIHVKCVANC